MLPRWNGEATTMGKYQVEGMRRLDIVIPEDLERELRVRVAELFSGERGAISRAVTEAIRLWLSKREPAKKR